MKKILPSLTGIMLCALGSSSGADPTNSLPTKPGEAVHSAVTDRPSITDMSHADPKTWHSLPPAAQLSERRVKQEMAEKHRDRGNG
jgi:hypothetical protein